MYIKPHGKGAYILIYFRTKKSDAMNLPQTWESYGGFSKTYEKGQEIFCEGEAPKYFNWLIEGEVKTISINQEGKEFIQRLFTAGESFGDPALLMQVPYPTTAVVMKNCRVWHVPYQTFLKLLQNDFAFHFALTQALSKRVMYKTMMLEEVANEEAEHRILTLLDYIKQQTQLADAEVLIPITRQQLGDMTGLRVETVIRIIKRLADTRQVRLVQGKIYR